MRRKRHVVLATTLAAAVALGAGGCGDDDDDVAVTTGAGTATGQLAPTVPDDVGTTERVFTGGETRLDLAGRIADAFSTARIDVTAVPPATQDDGFVFPITGGRGSVVEHLGGLRFGVGGTGVDATDFRIDLRTGELTADVGGRRVPLLRVDTDADDPSDVEDAPVYLNREALPAVSGALDAVGQSDERLEIGLLDISVEG